jgi:microcystin-dependent protein
VIQSVVVKNGVFSVNLGEQDAFPAGLFDSDSLFLGVTVDGVELTPRKRLASVPYAISAGSGGIPKGGIIMWSGAVTQIPTGWALCDGLNGTPDLRDRFVVGAGSIYAIGAIGGSTTKNLSHTHAGSNHTHSMSHNHAYSGTVSISDSDHTVDDTNKNSRSVSAQKHQHAYSGGTTDASTTITGAAGSENTGTGGSAAQDIMPPYYALAFIIKL